MWKLVARSGKDKCAIMLCFAFSHILYPLCLPMCDVCAQYAPMAFTHVLGRTWGHGGIEVPTTHQR